MNNKIKSILKRANLDYKKELIWIVLINILLIAAMIVIYVYTHNRLFFIPFIFLIVLGNAITFYRYLFLYSKNINQLIKEFTYLFRYLYLDVNHKVKVNDALLALKEKASLKMNERFETFFNEIKSDHSFLPYLNFASSFSNVLIEEVMLNLYRYKQSANQNHLQHFNETYFKLKKFVEEEEEKDSSRQYEFVKTSAIIGTALILILVVIVTIMIVEQYIYG